jgi:hypothetical protein
MHPSTAYPLSIKLIEGYYEAIETARRKGYNSHLNIPVYKEIYDDESWHVTACMGDVVIGTIRITPPPLSPIHDWTNNQADLPFHDKVVNVTKGFMLPQYRKNGIFKLIFASLLLHVFDKGFEFAIGGYQPSVKSKAFTERLGFEEKNQLLDCSVPPYEKTQIIPIICDLNHKYQNYMKEYNEALKMVGEGGFKVKEGLLIG